MVELRGGWMRVIMLISYEGEGEKRAYMYKRESRRKVNKSN